MKIYNPFRFLTRLEWAIWLGSVAVVVASFLIGGGGRVLSLIASLIGVTALIFIARGDVTGQILCIVFSILYAIVSFEQRYYGEMITYACMSLPASAASVVSWLKHPYATEDHSEVRMVRMPKTAYLWAFLWTALVSGVFYWILRWLGNAALFTSTVSVATSFMAAYLLFRRSPYYALAYAANDVVLIVLWCIAAVKDLSALSMVACFAAFLLNDIYGFLNWLRVRSRQDRAEARENVEG